MLGIINGKIYTMTGLIIENGMIFIEDGKIKDFGENIVFPEGIKIIDAEGKMITPGLIDPHSHLGISEEGIGFEGWDYNEYSNPVTPHMRSIDGIYPFDRGLVEAYQGGITTAIVAPGSANAIGGTVSAIKTYGHRVDDMIVKDPVAMKMAFGENIKRVFGSDKKEPMTRMGIMALIRENLYKAREYMELKEEAEKKGEKKPAFDMKLEALIPVLKKEIPAKIHAHRTDDVHTAIRLAKEFDINLTLDHCTEGHLIAKDLGKEKYPVILGPSLSTASKYELRNRSFTTPNELYKEGVPFSIMTDHPVIPAPQITLCAGLAHRSGLPEIEALKAITVYAAEITGISDRVGTIQDGKDADLVIWTKNPVKDIDNEVFTTIIDGKVAYQLGKDEKVGF